MAERPRTRLRPDDTDWLLVPVETARRREPGRLRRALTKNLGRTHRYTQLARVTIWVLLFAACLLTRAAILTVP